MSLRSLLTRENGNQLEVIQCHTSWLRQVKNTLKFKRLKQNTFYAILRIVCYRCKPEILTLKAFQLVFTAFYAASMSAKFVTDAIKAEVENSTQDQEEFAKFSADPLSLIQNSNWETQQKISIH